MSNGEIEKKKSENTPMLVLSYLGLLCLVPLFVEKQDQEVQWHAKHGLVILIAEFVVLVGLGMISFVLSQVSQLFSCLTGCIGPFIILAGLAVFHIMLIMKAIKGERMLIPGVSQYVDRIKF